MKHSLVLAGAVAAAFALGGCGHTTPITSGTATPSPTYSPNVSSEYPIPTANSQPAGIIRTATALWFTEEAANKIGFLNQNAVISDYPLPRPNSKPLNLTVGEDGNLWITEFGGDAIAKFDVATLGFTECDLPLQTGATPTPFGIAPGNDGNLWVTDPASNGVWRIQPGCGSFAFFPIPTANAGPESITVGPDSALWFVEANVDKIGRIAISAAAGTPATEYPVTVGAGPGVIVEGSDNAVWFTETKSDKIGRMLTTGALASETPLTGVGSPYGLVLGPDGNFYIGDQTKSAIVQYVTSSGTITSYPTKTANAGPYALTIGPDNEVYFTEQTANQIGQFLYFNP